MSTIIAAIKWISRRLNWVAMGGLVAMLALCCADIIMRLLDRPILGTYEVVALLGAITASFALAQTTIEGGHVAVEFIMTRFPPAMRKTVFILVNILGAGLFLSAAWELVWYAFDLRAAGEVSMTLQLPFYPILFGISFCCFMVAVILLTDAFSS